MRVISDESGQPVRERRPTLHSRLDEVERLDEQMHPTSAFQLPERLFI